ncbi:large ribosomal subunit protein uL1m-like [Clavelina lepadiformis]|uniref:large ribosomal subunit protein uL1m-like n=1 Tax=Clavelina lepadiformis TaxID=159417 RepID=UPI0040437645
METLVKISSLLRCRFYAATTQSALTKCRKVHTTSHVQNNAHHKTRFEILCELNKTLYIHRNAQFGVQPIFYRGNRKIDMWERHQEKLRRHQEWKTFSRQIDILEAPVDDVYLKEMYKAEVYSPKQGIKMLKNYAKLDMVNMDSIITLRLGLKTIKRKKAKGKRAGKNLTFCKSTTLPHSFNHRNKVCYFTDDKEVAAEALHAGVYAAGASDLITKVLNHSVKGNIYFCTSSYANVITTHEDLTKKLGNFLPNKFFGIADDIDTVSKYINETIYSNFSGENTHCLVKVGKLDQGIDEIFENIVHIVRVVNEQDKGGLVLNADLSCMADPLTIDITDVLSDKDDDI